MWRGRGRGGENRQRLSSDKENEAIENDTVRFVEELSPKKNMEGARK